MPFAVVLWALALLPGLSAAQPSEPLPVLVSPSWVLEHRSDPRVVLVQVGFNRREFQRSHPEGARFVWYEHIATSNVDASTELPDAAAMQEILRSLGISDGSVVVITHTERNLWAAARMLWSLESYGMAGRVTIVSGGNDALKAAGHPMATGMPEVARGRVTVTADPSRSVDAATVLARLHDASAALVDLRPRTLYDGTAESFRSGHIPGAMSLPSTALVDSLGRLKNDPSLREQFGLSAIDTTKPLVMYCSVGQAASVGYLAARRLGYRVALYDGSYQDWNLHGDDYPVVSPKPKN